MAHKTTMELDDLTYETILNAVSKSKITSQPTSMTKIVNHLVCKAYNKDGTLKE